MTVSPLFPQARWPVFLEPSDDYVKGFVHPQLQRNFESIDDDDKELARYKFRQLREPKRTRPAPISRPAGLTVP
jgi:hypothetical protein